MTLPLLRSATGLFDAVLPPGCASCGIAVSGDGPPLCVLCRSRLPRLNPPWCQRCGATHSGDFASHGRCLECETWPHELRRAAAPYRYAPPASRLLQGLKYRGWRALAPFMGAAMQPAARRIVPRERPVLVPVPLAAARRRERGFNQAEVLARGLQGVTGWPVARLLRRRRAGPAQATLGRRARTRRVQLLYHVDRVAVGHIRCRRVSADPERSGAADSQLGPVLLVDDVLTTGATAAACAAALCRAGLRCAGVVSFARSLPRPEEET